MTKSVRVHSKRCPYCYGSLYHIEDTFHYIDAIHNPGNQITSLRVERVFTDKVRWKIKTNRQNIYILNSVSKFKRERALFNSYRVSITTWALKEKGKAFECKKCKFWLVISEDNQLDMASGKEKYEWIKNRCITDW